MPLQAHVSVAKAGVDALSNSLALEFGPRGVTSNVISPGPIAGTEGMDRLSKADGLADSLKGIPLGRWGTVKEIADATIYLFSDAANYVNGQILVGEYPSSSMCRIWLEVGLMTFGIPVDGAAWRTQSPNMGGFKYPDFLLGDEVITGVKGSKKSKL